MMDMKSRIIYSNLSSLIFSFIINRTPFDARAIVHN